MLSRRQDGLSSHAEAVECWSVAFPGPPLEHRPRHGREGTGMSWDPRGCPDSPASLLTASSLEDVGMLGQRRP